MSDNEFLKVDGTKIEGRSASEVKTDLSLTTTSSVQFGSLGLGNSATNKLDVGGGMPVFHLTVSEYLMRHRLNNHIQY